MDPENIRDRFEQANTEDLLLMVVLDRMHPKQLLHHVAATAGRAAFNTLYDGGFETVEEGWEKLREAVTKGIEEALDAMDEHWHEVANRIAFERDAGKEIDDILTGGYL